MQRTVTNLTHAYKMFILDPEAGSVLARPNINGKILFKWIENDR